MPVIMLTAVSDAKQAVECLKAAAHDYLVKPVDVDELLISVMRAVERLHLLGEAKQSRRELEDKTMLVTSDRPVARAILGR